MTQEIITFKTALLQTGTEFLKVNHIDKASWLNKRLSIHPEIGEPVFDNNTAPMAYSANINNKTDPLGYAVELLNLNVVHIPAGRKCFFILIAGRIFSISMTLPLKPLSFDEMKAMAETIDQSFRNAGYIFYRGNTGMTETSFGDNRRFKYDTYGRWRLPDKGDLFGFSLQVATFDSYSNVAFTIPLSPGVDKNAPRTYLINFYATVEGEVYKELFTLRDARRIAVNHDKDKPIPLELWLDDPDWRPEGWKGKWL